MTHKQKQEQQAAMNLFYKRMEREKSIHIIERRVASSAKSRLVTIYTEAWDDISELFCKAMGYTFMDNYAKLPYLAGFCYTHSMQKLIENKTGLPLKLIES